MSIYEIGDILVKRDRVEREMDVRYKIVSHITQYNLYIVSKMNKREYEFDNMMNAKQIYEKFILVNK
ncbi:MAG: hypothetical protein ACRDDY_17005 [Clostridium sp.]|uniref:hypothetical protein n=1 Tax=Clostridium sp. TaxID=1506 RepID=UPI003EE44863